MSLFNQWLRPTRGACLPAGADFETLFEERIATRLGWIRQLRASRLRRLRWNGLQIRRDILAALEVLSFAQKLRPFENLSKEALNRD